MKLLLLLVAVLPVCLSAQQPINPVMSNEFLLLQQRFRDSSIRATDSTRKVLASQKEFNASAMVHLLYYPEIKIQRDGSGISFFPRKSRVIGFSGTFSNSVGLQVVNRGPLLQRTYAQGRPVNGIAQWQGPDANESFSWGPAIHTLEYDGSAYPWDNNGRLVPLNQGNGIRGKVYDNDILKTAFQNGQDIQLTARYREDNAQLAFLSLSAGRSGNTGFIRDNRNTGEQFGIKGGMRLQKFILNTGYSTRSDHFSHSNRFGFLNRAYMSSLLAPASFDQRKGLTAAPNRGHSINADNALYLLQNEAHFAKQRRKIGNVEIEHRGKNITLGMNHAFEKSTRSSDESFEPGTADFLQGKMLQRNSEDRNYTLTSSAQYRFYGSFKTVARINYIYSDNRTNIDYLQQLRYRYQRTAHDVSVSASTEKWVRRGILGFTINDRFYYSNTSRGKAGFLPGVSGYFTRDQVFDSKNVSLKVYTSFTRFASELPISRSYANSSLLKITPNEINSFMPVTELSTYRNVDALLNRELISGFELFKHGLGSVTFQWFNRKTIGDVFPVWNGGNLVLKNLATHRNRGIEAAVEFLRKTNLSELIMSSRLSWMSYRNKVIEVTSGYDYQPIAGFSNINKSIVKGYALGVITGSTYAKNADGELLIGSDGFPLVDQTRKVIGNPIPDFLLKWSNNVAWRNKLFFNFDIEWKKGGDMWNGTQAALDYYGRSFQTDLNRNVRGYIFPGVMANGSHNTIAVDFANPTLPLQQNRWVRYGPSGVGEEYIQDASAIRVNNISLTWKPFVKKLQRLSFALSAGNILIWSANRGADPSQLLFDERGTSGLDFFNLPSAKTFDFTTIIQL